MKIAKNYLKQVILEETKKIIYKNNKINEIKLGGARVKFVSTGKTKKTLPSPEKPIKEAGFGSIQQGDDLQNKKDLETLIKVIEGFLCLSCLGTGRPSSKTSRYAIFDKDMNCTNCLLNLSPDTFSISDRKPDNIILTGLRLVPPDVTQNEFNRIGRGDSVRPFIRRINDDLIKKFLAQVESSKKFFKNILDCKAEDMFKKIENNLTGSALLQILAAAKNTLAQLEKGSEQIRAVEDARAAEREAALARQRQANLIQIKADGYDLSFGTGGPRYVLTEPEPDPSDDEMYRHYKGRAV